MPKGSKTKFSEISQFLGYRNKGNLTNLPPGTLIEGSQNVLLNIGERVGIRNGYVLDGQVNTGEGPILSSFDWFNQGNGERHLRSFRTTNGNYTLQYRYTDSTGAVTWNTISSTFDAGAFNYIPFYDTTEEFFVLLFVNGDGYVYEWDGGITTLASVTSNTITNQGTETWAQLGFYENGTRDVLINGAPYTYTGGENTNTLTGVSPDPTGFAYPAGTVIIQDLRKTAISSMTSIPSTFTPNLIGCLENQVFLGSFVSRDVYLSQVDDYTTYTFSSPRTLGEGWIYFLDNPPNLFVPQDGNMYFSGGTSDWYETSFTDNTAHTDGQIAGLQKNIFVQKGAGISQAAVTNVKNNIVFATFEPTLDAIGPLALLQNEQQTNLSDPIAKDFNTYAAKNGFENAAVCYFRENVYLALPALGIVRIYNMSTRTTALSPQFGGLATTTFEKFWEAPQILPISRWSIINGELYGHSSLTNETYQMFVGWNDNGNNCSAAAVFSYQNYGSFASKKNFVEFFTSGFITTNTQLNATLLFDYGGAKGTNDWIINGADGQIVSIPGTGTGSLGQNSLGEFSLAGRGPTIDNTIIPHFQQDKTTTQTDFRVLGVIYSTDSLNQQWEIETFGPAVQLSTATDFDISQ